MNRIDRFIEQEMANVEALLLREMFTRRKCVECGSPGTHQREYRDVCPTDRGDEVREGQEWICDDCDDSGCQEQCDTPSHLDFGQTNCQECQLLAEWVAQQPDEARQEQAFLRAERETLTREQLAERDEYDEWSQSLDMNEWDSRCPEHGEPYDSLGHCSVCEAMELEERRQEGFLTPQEVNAKILRNAWAIGEEWGPNDGKTL